MFEQFERFDMAMKPKRQKLRAVAWLLAFPAVWAHKAHIIKTRMEGIKPPYLMLCNHNAFFDFKAATVAIFPHRANYIVAIDGFLRGEWLLRTVGCICKRKFTSDTVLVRQLKRVINNGDIAVVYPEARYSLCGTNAVLPESLGKLAKFLDVPVVSFICHGHHIDQPFWNLHERKVKNTVEEMTLLFTQDEVRALSVDEINAKIEQAFVYDDFAWQKQNNIRVKYAGRAEKLHKVLYQCPACGVEYKMDSKGDELMCTHCGKRWRMSELGELSAVEGKTEFSHIPDWYEWEREQVRNEILAGKYSFKSKVRVDALPNAKGYIDLGAGTLTHDLNGFVLEGEYEGEYYRLEKPVKSLYSCHIEYEYLGKFGDCVDLNTTTDTFYIYPEGCDFAVTKIALATEELYNLNEAGRLPAQRKD